MAVPGPITSPTSIGTNRLIRDGAEPLLCADDLIRHFPDLLPVATDRAKTEVPRGDAGPPVRGAEAVAGPVRPVGRARAAAAKALPAPPPPPEEPKPVPIPEDLSGGARQLAELLLTGPASIDQLTSRLSLPVSAVLGLLSTLELRGLASQEVGIVSWTVEGIGTCAKLS
jgi:DNA processing protein